jgi:hypothetical protein
MNRSAKVSLSVVAAAGLFVAGSATGAVAGKLVTGDQVATHTITTRNIAPESIGMLKLKQGVREAITAAGPGTAGPKGDKGDAGPQGAKGDKGDPGTNGTNGAKGDKGDAGPQGAKGDKGDPGAKGAKGDKGDPGANGVNDVRLAITDATTPDVVQSDDGHWLVQLPGDQLDGGSDSETDLLTFDLAAGRYLVDVTAQFYNLIPTSAENYGVVTLYRGADHGSATNLPGTIFTADLPDSTGGKNAGQTTGHQIIEVTAPTTVYVRGSFRTDDTSQRAVAGAQAVITRIG